jgi:hypothetical protein
LIRNEPVRIPARCGVLEIKYFCRFGMGVVFSRLRQVQAKKVTATSDNVRAVGRGSVARAPSGAVLATVVACSVLWGGAARAAEASHPSLPTAYTETVQALPGGEQTFSRSGVLIVSDRAAIPAHLDGKYDYPDQPATRTVLNLATHRSVVRVMPDGKPDCRNPGSMEGDIGDAFSDPTIQSLLAAPRKDVGKGLVHGVSTERYAVVVEGHKFIVWIAPDTGLVLKVTGPGAGRGAAPGDPKVRSFYEVKQFSLGAPDRAVFDLPPACARALNRPLKPPAAPPAQDAGVGAPVAGRSAAYGPIVGDTGGCEVTFAVVNAKTMAPYAKPVKIVVSVPAPELGGFHPMKTLEGRASDTSSIIAKIPEQFAVNLRFGDGGETGSGMGKVCTGGAPVELLFLVRAGPEPWAGEWVMSKKPPR